MNKSIVLIALFCGALFGINKAEAKVGTMDIFKGLETLQRSPWDPREEQKSESDEDNNPEIRIPIK